MSDKRSGGILAGLTSKRQKLNQQTAGISISNSNSTGGAKRSAQDTERAFLKQPVSPEEALQHFLTKCRQAALDFLPEEDRNKVVTEPFCEVEVRLGILSVKHASPPRRVVSSGAKNEGIAFDCTNNAIMQSGVSRRHFTQWTGTGKAEINALTRAFNVTQHSQIAKGNNPIQEHSYTQTVYTGYTDGRRICFAGVHPEQAQGMGTEETKEKLITLDLTLPAASYDIRANLSSEKGLPLKRHGPGTEWKYKRVKRRRSYSCPRIAWQIDVTEVSTTSNPALSQPAETTVDHEIEIELQEKFMLQLINESRPEDILTMAQQAWHILKSLNPLADALDVEQCLKEHQNQDAVTFALAQLDALRTANEAHRHRGGGYTGTQAEPLFFDSPLDGRREVHKSLKDLTEQKFLGCMPVNFTRHNLEQIQKLPASSYHCSEKTDGVRHLLVFLEGTAVLVDRAMKCKQPEFIEPPESPEDPFASVLSLIKPGTVLDGEVVMNRKVEMNGKETPRPIFIVFDVLSIATNKSIMHLPFAQRLWHLKQATFRTPTASRDMFDEKSLTNARIPLPLVRKNFVARSDIDDKLCRHVREERGMRIYSNGMAHNHLTDGIIFQPNLPYVCGTDTNLLKWKYLDTVTIDTELVPLRSNDPEDKLRTACLGEEGTRVDLSRFVSLPKSERLRMEADKFAAKGKARICEVGLDPESGEWYYLTFRPDKIIPNHISTVLGSLMELAEHVTAEELRYRMSIPEGAPDIFAKDLRTMMRQMLEHQRKRNKTFLKKQRA